MTDWDKWDRTSNILHGIEWRAIHMKRMAGEIQEWLEKLKERPAFETTAHDSLKKLEQDVAVLHAFTKAILDIYTRLPETA